MFLSWWCVVLAVSVLLLATGQPRIAMWLAGTSIVIVLANWRKKQWEW